jgi:dTMP kinase
MNAPGTLIVFEGIDGTGKSTQVELLAKALRDRGLEVVTSREPTDGSYGQQLRESMTLGRLSPEEELALFHNDRRDHIEKLISPALTEGKIIILDRYYFSTMAYQSARGFDVAAIRAENEAFAPIPDWVFILELPVEDALARIGNRDGSGNTFEEEENLRACDKVFRELSEPFIYHLSANAPAEEIHQAIRGHLFPTLDAVSEEE